MILAVLSLVSFGAEFDFRDRFGIDLLAPLFEASSDDPGAVPLEWEGGKVNVKAWGGLTPSGIRTDRAALSLVYCRGKEMSRGEADRLFDAVAADLSACDNLIRRWNAQVPNGASRVAVWVGRGREGLPLGALLEVMDVEDPANGRVRLRVGLKDAALGELVEADPFLLRPAMIRLGASTNCLAMQFDLPVLTGKVTRVPPRQNQRLDRLDRGTMSLTQVLVDTASRKICRLEGIVGQSQKGDAAARSGDFSQLLRFMRFSRASDTNGMSIVTMDQGTLLRKRYIREDCHDARFEIEIPTPANDRTRPTVYRAIVRMVDETPEGDGSSPEQINKIHERNRAAYHESLVSKGMSVVKIGKFEGVWGRNSQFDIFVLMFDPGGRGVFSGFMTMGAFDWKFDGREILTCQVTAPEQFVKEMKEHDVSPTFTIKYHADKNYMEVLQNGMFKKEEKPLILAYLGPENQVKEALEQMKAEE